jgi:hypothetical protein
MFGSSAAHRVGLGLAVALFSASCLGNAGRVTQRGSGQQEPDTAGEANSHANVEFDPLVETVLDELTANEVTVDDGPEPEPEPGGYEKYSVGTTVEQAASSSCSTTSVKGLSEQIIQEGACINPNAYVKLPAVSNLSLGSAVFPYLEKPARDALVAALQAKPSTKMSVNSMLRTVAQQYLLYRWYQSGKCGIGLAASPGNSNHETGLALDINEYTTWKSTLTAKGFQWYGSADVVHFDYEGVGAVSHKGLDVKAFQRLWNRNNPADKIAEDGAWGPMTQARMKKAPAAGFAKGPICGG